MLLISALLFMMVLWAASRTFQRLALEREHAVVMTADDGQPSNRQRVGTVTLREDERALVGVAAAGAVGVVEFWNAKLRGKGPTRKTARHRVCGTG